MNIECLAQGDVVRGLAIYSEFNLELGFRALEAHKGPTPQASRCYAQHYHPFGLERPGSTRFIGIRDEAELSHKLFLIHLKCFFRNTQGGMTKGAKKLRIIAVGPIHPESHMRSTFYEIRLGEGIWERSDIFGSYEDEVGAGLFNQDKSDVFALIAKTGGLTVEIHEAASIDVPDLYRVTTERECHQAA